MNHKQNIVFQVQFFMEGKKKHENFGCKYCIRKINTVWRLCHYFLTTVFCCSLYFMPDPKSNEVIVLF